MYLFRTLNLRKMPAWKMLTLYVTGLYYWILYATGLFHAAGINWENNQRHFYQVLLLQGPMNYTSLDSYTSVRHRQCNRTVHFEDIVREKIANRRLLIRMDDYSLLKIYVGT
jgi:hypothetical protein